MKVCKNLSEVAKKLNVEELEVQKEFEKYSLISNYMTIRDITVYFESGNKRLDYVLVDENNNKDCEEYLMEYGIKEYEWEVKTDDIVGIEKCKVIGVSNDKMEINRTTVITESGTQLNRIAVFILDKEDDDYKKDGCVYFWEKE